MLTEAEDGLIATVKASALGQKLASVGSLPDLDPDSLVKRFGTDAPAVYVSMGSFPIADGAARLSGGLVCVGKNSRGHEAARKGDGKAIGMYQILEGVIALVDGQTIGGAGWRVTSADFLADETLYKSGLYVGVVRIDTSVSLPPALDEAALAEFQTMASDFDLPPHVGAVEHAKWLQNPPDLSTSAPELSDQQTLQP